MSELIRTRPRLIVITDTTVASEADVEARVVQALALATRKAVLVQLRDNALPDRRRLDFGARLAAECRRHDQWFVVNDRIDMAVLLGADGVHLGEASVVPEDVRTILPSAWISRACHEPLRARQPDVDAVLLSPIAATRKGRTALGFEGLREARRVLSAEPAGAPALYALGGVDSENAAACLDAGADGVAVVGAVLDGRHAAPLLETLGILAGAAPRVR